MSRQSNTNKLILFLVIAIFVVMLTALIVMFTKEPYHESDEVESSELVESTVSEERNTLTALSMGQIYEIDLNGDGVAETFCMEIQGGRTLTVDGITFEEAYFEEISGYLDSPDVATFYLFDIDVSDGYKEIGLYDDGPSGDPKTSLYRYENRRLVYIGSFADCPVAWSNLTFSEADKEQDASEYSFAIEVPGDGTVRGSMRYDVIQTDWVTNAVWELTDATLLQAKLQIQEQSVYEFSFWQELRDNPDTYICQPETAVEIWLYSDRDVSSEALVIPAGEKVWFVRYYPEECWLEIQYDIDKEEDRKTGYIKLKDKGDFDVILPNGNFVKWDLFSNLNMAD
ncbi:MAG: hypothetical protein E7291_02425 [Lachnospiraceae bacterium]|nr:hypothetical protein [Lachnospiraceae bacterium]